MRILTFLLLSLLALYAWANEPLWEKLRTEPNLVVLMRHTQPAGGNPLTWDDSGHCKGESMLTAEGKAHAWSIGQAFAAAVSSQPSSALRCAAAGKPPGSRLENHF